MISSATERFESARPRLVALATRMLGSALEAEDAVQEAWLRMHGTDATIDNLDGWLTTVVSRVCLDVLRRRGSRPETPWESVPDRPAADDPAADVLLADAVELGMSAVLDRLAPAERVAFVLHDLFGLPFDEVARVLDRSVPAARQLASRGRRRIRGGSDAVPRAHARGVVDAFLTAAKGGDLATLVAMLDPDVVLTADDTVVAMGGVQPLLSGADAVAGRFSGGARALLPALVGDDPGLVWSLRGVPQVGFAFTLATGAAGNRVVAIRQFADPERLATVRAATATQWAELAGLEA